MTAAELLTLIAAALLLQLTVGIGWSVWRQRRAGLAPQPAERAAAPARSDAAWSGWREFRVSQRQMEDEAQSQCSFHLQPVDGLPLPPFKPGQFLTFSLDVNARAPDGSPSRRTVTRCYSLSDRPEASHYRVTIKRVTAPAEHPELPPGLSSSHFHDQVHVGDILRVKAPAGHFFLDPDPQLPVVLIGGGIGITPMISMLRWCVEHQPQRTVHLFYGLRNSREHAFKAGLEAIAAAHPALRLQVVYSRPGACDLQGRDYQHQGHVDIDLLRRTLPHGRHSFHVCGPPAMMGSLVPALADWGVPASDIHHEAFGPASVAQTSIDPSGADGESLGEAATDAARTTPAAAVAVTFRRTGRTLNWDGRDASLLEFAERHGIAVESGCRSGGCGSCETRVLQGAVQYAQPPDHDVAAGHGLLCVGRPAAAPVSALILDA